MQISQNLITITYFEQAAFHISSTIARAWSTPTHLRLAVADWVSRTASSSAALRIASSSVSSCWTSARASASLHFTSAPSCDLPSAFIRQVHCIEMPEEAPSYEHFNWLHALWSRRNPYGGLRGWRLSPHPARRLASCAAAGATSKRRLPNSHLLPHSGNLVIELLYTYTTRYTSILSSHLHLNPSMTISYT